MPDNWRETTLGEVAEIKQGETIAVKDLAGGAHPVFGANGIVGWHHRGNLAEDSVALGCRGSCGTVHIAPAGSFLANNVMGVRALAGETTVGFLAVMLEFADLRRFGVISGQVQEQITRKSLAPLPVLLPPLGEQRRIVDLIGSIDTYINELEVQISETRKAEAALREDLFASLWTSERVAPLGTLLTIQRGSSPRPISKFLRNDGLGTPWIRIGDADPDSMFIETTAQCINLEGFTSPRFVYPGDFLLSNSMSFGRPYVSKIKGCIHDGWLRFSDENGVFSTEFLFNLMLSRALQERFAALAAGSGVKNLKIEKVASVEVPVPDRAGQQSIVETLERVRRVATDATLQAAAVRDLRAGVLSELLSGERLLDDSYDTAVGL